jgi:SNF2 family DNA or RNA helicase
MQLTEQQIADAIYMANNPDVPNFSKAGTGKTHTTLRAIEIFDKGPTLIVGPVIAVDWWAEQAKEFLGADVQVLTSGDTKLRGGADVYVTTFGVARNTAHYLYEFFDNGALVVDESHNVRNPEAKQTQAIFGKRADGRGGLVSCFDTVWCLTGTPIEGYANDMWTQAGVLHPSVFDRYSIRTYDDFCRTFTYRKQKQFHPRMQPVWKISGNTNEALLHRIVYDEIGALRRQEAPGLPALRMRRLHVPVRLSADVRKAMRGKTDEQIVHAMNDPDSPISNAWRAVGVAKVDEVVHYSGELLRDGPLLLGAWHHDVMDAYVDKFKAMGKEVVKVSGKTPDRQKAVIRKAFNAGNIDVLVGQMKAMGTSWNIQEACSNVIIAETVPSPAIVEQFYKRVYRFGQKRPCQVDIVLSNTPVDESLDGVRLRKQASDERINK